MYPLRRTLPDTLLRRGKERKIETVGSEDSTISRKPRESEPIHKDETVTNEQRETGVSRPSPSVGAPFIRHSRLFPHLSSLFSLRLSFFILRYSYSVTTVLRRVDRTTLSSHLAHSCIVYSFPTNRRMFVRLI